MSIVVAVDGGGSKTDVVVADSSGAVLARHRGPGCSLHAVGLTRAVAVIDESVHEAVRVADLSPESVALAGCYLTAMDLPSEQEAMREALARAPWASRLVVDNDVFALLRAGTDAADAAVVVCGTGINGAAIRADGATARILALGHRSGDWGGGSGLAEEVLWYAARAEDGRGAPTALRAALLAWTGRASVHEVITDVHLGVLDVSSWWDRVPEIFALAHEGDEVARSLVVRQGAEIAAMAGSLLARLDLAGSQVPVVLGGGIAASGDELLLRAAADELAARAPRARLVVSQRPPVDGALDLMMAMARA
jgi:N-acetylglucosamine kinase-like BadF-type ATPase